MSVLDDEQQKALLNALEGGSPEPEPEETVEAASEPEEQEQEAAEPERAEEPEEEELPEEGHHVPYNRFKNVIDTRNTLRSQVQELEEHVLYLKSQGEKPRQEAAPPKEKSIWDDFDEDADSEAPAEDNGRLVELEARMGQIDDHIAERELEVELEHMEARFPDVPKTIVLEAIINDPSLSALDIAEGYSEFIAEIEEAALARHVQEQKERSAPRRVQTMSGAESPGETPSKRPKSLEDSREALLQYLNQGN